ncbi:MAG: hypothetical protein P1T08_18775 [Acidimicrobiia bacterium]|nr:hypothetical protein [Acidimicrobiia bacterium]
MRDELPETETETYEHIPWSQLTLTNETADRGKWMYFATALLVAAAIAAVIARMIWQPEVAVAVPSLMSTVPLPAVTILDPPSAPALYSEADLLAALPPRDIEQSVATTAERYARQWAEGRSDDSWTYVEWVAVESTEDVGEGLFRVRLLMQLLHGGEDGTVRLPVEGIEVMVLIDEESVSVLDLPSPARVGTVPVISPPVDPTEVPEAVASAALDVVSPWGVGTIIGGGVADDRWRVEVAVGSDRGLERVVAVWLNPDGSPTHPMP